MLSEHAYIKFRFKRYLKQMKTIPQRYKTQCPICDRNDVLNIVHHLKTIHSINADDWLFKAKLICLIIVYSWPLPNQINVKPTMIKPSTLSIMVVRNSDQGDLRSL